MENQKKVVRNIPIFIESRNEILINDETDSHSFQPPPSKVNYDNNLNQQQQHSATNQAQSSASSDNVTEKVQVPQSELNPATATTSSDTEHTTTTNLQEQRNLENSIHAIQTIQNSVLGLMKKIEEYNGENQKEYVYLDEMLTQSLIKLDNIDTNVDVEGKENVKNARREAIKCINSLIMLLEEKNEEFKKSKNTKEQTM